MDTGGSKAKEGKKLENGGCEGVAAGVGERGRGLGAMRQDE